MRDRKLIVIIGLLFLLLLSLGILFLLYQQNQQIQNAKHQNINIIVAKHTIAQNKKITKEDLKSISIAKNDVTFKVMIANEIIDKYASVPIYKDEPIRDEKISKIIEKEDLNSTAKIAKHDLYNISTKLFRNPNYMLKSGDKIDIVGVWGEKDDLVVKYIANSAEVFGFLFSGILEEKALKVIHKKVKDKKTKKEIETTTTEFAQEMLVDTDEDIITAIIEAHNKGDQLWMVMSGAQEREKVIETIKQSVQVQKPKPAVKKKKRRSRNYQSATIEYGTDSKQSVTVWK